MIIYCRYRCTACGSDQRYSHKLQCWQR